MYKKHWQVRNGSQGEVSLGYEAYKPIYKWEVGGAGQMKSWP